MGVARPRRFTAHDDADEATVVALRRGGEIEAGRVDVTGLDAVHALERVHQMIVIGVNGAVIDEFAGGEIVVVVREIAIKRSCQRREIARRRLLHGIGQAGGVVEEGVLHAQPARLLRHPLGEGVLASGEALGGDRGRVIRRFRHQAENDVAHRHALAGLEPELRRGAVRGVRRNRQPLVERELSVVDRLENQIERHHLG